MAFYCVDTTYNVAFVFSYNEGNSGNCGIDLWTHIRVRACAASLLDDVARGDIRRNGIYAINDAKFRLPHTLTAADFEKAVVNTLLPEFSKKMQTGALILTDRVVGEGCPPFSDNILNTRYLSTRDIMSIIVNNRVGIASTSAITHNTNHAGYSGVQLLHWVPPSKMKNVISTDASIKIGPRRARFYLLNERLRAGARAFVAGVAACGR